MDNKRSVLRNKRLKFETIKTLLVVVRQGIQNCKGLRCFKKKSSSKAGA